MKTPKELEPLLPSLQAVQSLIDHFKKRGIVIGGAAICLLGEPRMTADVDALLLVSIEDVQELLKTAQQIGFVPRVKNVEQFARKNRVVLLRHEPSGTDVDISLGALPFEQEAVQRSQLVRTGNLRVRVPTVEDLIILKAIAHRPKDLLDVRNLVALYSGLDFKRIENWVRQFADLMEGPELWNDIAPMLRKK